MGKGSERERWRGVSVVGESERECRRDWPLRKQAVIILGSVGGPQFIKLRFY